MDKKPRENYETIVWREEKNSSNNKEQNKENQK